MYTSTLGATPQCLTEEQHAEAVRMCACKQGNDVVLKGFGAGDAYDSYDFSTQPSTKPSCAPQITMPADFDPNDPCTGAGRPLCGPRLGRPSSGSGTSTSRPPAPEDDYEDTVVQGALLKQQIMVFGLLGLVIAAGGYVTYRVIKKKG